MDISKKLRNGLIYTSIAPLIDVGKKILTYSALITLLGCGGGSGISSDSNISEKKDNQTLSSSSCQISPLEEVIINRDPEVTDNKFNMAFILISDKEQDITIKRQILNKYKTKFESTFNSATLNLASMDTSYNIVDLVIEREDNIHGFDVMKTTKMFFKDHKDEFDFIAIYSTFRLPKYGGTQISVIQNPASFDTQLDLSKDFGSEGKLKGVMILNDYYLQKEIDMGDNHSSQNLLLHETGHYWGVEVGDNFKGRKNLDLEIKQQNIHFYPGLQSPYKTGTPLGSSYWESNCDGSYSRKDEQGLKKYHPFQLFSMGLLTTNNYDFDKKFQLFDAGGSRSNKEFNDKNAIKYNEISINNIISVGNKLLDSYF